MKSLDFDGEGSDLFNSFLEVRLICWDEKIKFQAIWGGGNLRGSDRLKFVFFELHPGAADSGAYNI